MTIMVATVPAQHSLHFAEEDNHDGDDNHDFDDHQDEGHDNYADENDYADHY